MLEQAIAEHSSADMRYCVEMNRLRPWYCRSAHWQCAVARDLLDWALDEAPLDDHLHEPVPHSLARAIAATPRVRR